MYFSVCIPAYNRKDTIIRTIKSLVEQTFTSFEVLIVDDGSTDGTKDEVNKYLSNLKDARFRYFYKENGGKHSALNIGIKESMGRFFVILDSDDWFQNDTLERMHDLCAKIENDESFCGIMGKSFDTVANKMIGDPFDLSNPVSSYFDYHFVISQKIHVLDCCEAVKTKILKQYSFPEQPGMKFVPEAYVFDQIGVNYKLLLTNEIFKLVEYLPDGMTMDANYKKKNNVGYLYHYISRIENVLGKKKMSFSLRIKLSTLCWWRYWQCVKLDKEKQGPRVKKVTFYGFLVRLMSPLINIVFKAKYSN